MCGIPDDDIAATSQQQMKATNNPEESTTQTSDRPALFSDGRSAVLPGKPRPDAKEHPPHLPTGTTEVLTFYPTWQEFRNFLEYMKKIEAVGAHLKCGICKVVPPLDWTPRPTKKSDFSDMDRYRIKDPVREEMIPVQGKPGIYLKNHVPHQKTMGVTAFRKKSKEMAKTHDFKNATDPEAEYWNNIEKGQPIYGADSQGTLYEKGVEQFNMNELGTMFDQLEEVIPGGNTPNLYYGMAKTTFAFHSEDMDLYSINYLHLGEPKFWYGIAEEHADRFEDLMRQQFTGYTSDDCKAFMIHKNYVVNPSVLRAANIPYGTMIQHPNEFIITFPRGYHQGFNMGYNCAEAVNFATDRWIDFGVKANTCSCEVKRGFTLDMGKYLRKYRSAKEYDDWWFKKEGIERPQKTTISTVTTEETDSPVKPTLFDQKKKHAYLKYHASNRKRHSAENLDVEQKKVTRTSVEEDSDTIMTSSDKPKAKKPIEVDIMDSWLQRHNIEYKEIPKATRTFNQLERSSLITSISDSTKETAVRPRAQSVEKVAEMVLETDETSLTDGDANVEIMDELFDLSDKEPLEDVFNDETMDIPFTDSEHEPLLYKEYVPADYNLTGSWMSMAQAFEIERELALKAKDSEAVDDVHLSEINTVPPTKTFDAEVQQDVPEMFDSSSLNSHGPDNQEKSKDCTHMAMAEKTQQTANNLKRPREACTTEPEVVVKKMRIGQSTRIVIDIIDEIPSTSGLNIKVLNLDEVMDTIIADQEYSSVEHQSEVIHNNGAPASISSVENVMDTVESNSEVLDRSYIRSPEPSIGPMDPLTSPQKLPISTEENFDGDIKMEEDFLDTQTTSVPTLSVGSSRAPVYQPRSLLDFALHASLKARGLRID